MTTEALVPAAAAAAIATGGAGEIVLPQVIVDAGPQATARFLEFFAGRIANARTRAAYGRAVGQFLGWCEARGLGLRDVSPLHVAAYIRTHPGSVPTVKQHLAAIRMLGDWLVVNQVLPVNPAAAVRGPKHVVTKGATPVLSPAEARKLLESIDTGALAGLRDRALLSVMLYSFARVSAVLGMRRQDYFGQGNRGWLRLHEKGGKRHDVPVHHRAAAALDAYVEVGRLEEPKVALFQTMDPAGRRLTGRALDRRLVLAMIKRRAAAAGLPSSTCCHTFRATGITAYLSNGGTLEHAQQIAGHASPKTTKLYDRTADTVTVDEIERILI
ncbi:MAG: tyrosine-type recombinase/integrase [Acidobacteria bacterium]|nr:tyrosine-type recombinase/integrase [Acidobacteriota bacterium]